MTVTVTFIMTTAATLYSYRALVIVLLMTSLMLSNRQVAGNGSGAPVAACTAMAPNPTEHGGDPQGSAAPFTLSTSSPTYDPGETLTFTLTWNGAGSGFRGFLVKVKKSSSPAPYGTLSTSEGDVLCDGNDGNAVTHLTSAFKTSVDFTWVAPNTGAGTLEVVATVVQERQTYWVAKSLATLTDNSDDGTGNGGGEPNGPIPSPLTFDLGGCGTDKSCFRSPDNCAANECDYLLTWKRSGEFVAYEMAATLSSMKYVAMALSKDRNMGEDSVTQCVFDERTNDVIIANSYNRGTSNVKLDNHLYGLLESSFRGGYNDGLLTCSFRRRIDVGTSGSSSDQSNVFNLDSKYHILMVKGDAQAGFLFTHDPDDSTSSSVKVDMTSSSHVTVGGSDPSYPMIKAHGCLMVLAWIICASIGVLMPRHAKQLWGDHDIMDMKLWFQIHRLLMIAVFVTTIIAFVLIFVEVDGFSDLNESPDKAHPIIGIIVTALAVSNPIIAIFRCGPKDAKRPIFNWVHFLVGTGAHIGGFVNIYISTYMTKTQAPSGTRIVLIVFLVVHIATELFLLIFSRCIASNSVDDDMEMTDGGGPASKNQKNEKNDVIHTVVIIGYTVVTTILGIIVMVLLASG